MLSFIHFFLAGLLFPAVLAPPQKGWEETRRLAESQHEIVMLLIQKKEFNKVAPAAGKIFALNFPKDQEHLLVEEAKILTDQLLHHSQYAVAHKVLDSAIQAVKANGSMAQLYKEKAYLLKKEGKIDEAMKNFEKAVELENAGP